MRADIHDGQGAKTLRSMGRIQMRETNYLQIVKSGLHRTAGPYRSAKTGHEQMQQLRLRKAMLFDHLVGA